jgi:hypothetical protein
MPKTPEQKARSDKERSFPRCAEQHCNNVAGLDETHCGAHRPATIRLYETQAMQQLRAILEAQGAWSEHIDIFKDCLIALEKEGFTLTRQEPST